MKGFLPKNNVKKKKLTSRNRLQSQGYLSKPRPSLKLGLLLETKTTPKLRPSSILGQPSKAGVAYYKKFRMNQLKVILSPHSLEGGL